MDADKVRLLVTHELHWFPTLDGWGSTHQRKFVSRSEIDSMPIGALARWLRVAAAPERWVIGDGTIGPSERDRIICAVVRAQADWHQPR